MRPQSDLIARVKNNPPFRALRDARVIYLNNPKCGCSFVKRNLWDMSGVPRNTPVHNLRESPFTAELFELGDIENFFVFTFVRNPFLRIYSAYLDKIYPGTRTDEYVWNKFRTSFDVSPDAELSFREFVEILRSAKKTLDWDEHWRPQCINIMNNVVRPNFIGFTESLDRDFLTAMELSKIDTTSFQPGVVHKGKLDTASSILLELEDRGLVDAIQQIYEADFDTFGYAKDPTAGFASRKEPIRSSVEHEELHILAQLQAYPIGHHTDVNQEILSSPDLQSVLMSPQKDTESVHTFWRLLNKSVRSMQMDTLNQLQELRSANENLAGDNKKLAGDNKKLAGDNKKLAGDNKKLAGDNKKLAEDVVSLSRALEHAKRYPWKYFRAAIRQRRSFIS